MSNTVLQSVEKENTLCNYLLAAEVYSLWNLNRSPAFTLTFLCFSFQLPSKHGQRPAGILRCRHTFPAAYVDVQKPPPRPLLRTQMYHLYKSCRNTTCLQPIYCHRCGSFTWQDIRKKVTGASGSSLEDPFQLVLTLSWKEICTQYFFFNYPTAEEAAAVQKGKQLSRCLHMLSRPVLLCPSQHIFNKIRLFYWALGAIKLLLLFLSMYLGPDCNLVSLTFFFFLQKKLCLFITTHTKAQQQNKPKKQCFVMEDKSKTCQRTTPGWGVSAYWEMTKEWKNEGEKMKLGNFTYLL